MRSVGQSLECRPIVHLDSSTSQSEYPLLFTSAQRPICGGPGRSGELGNIVLCKRDHDGRVPSEEFDEFVHASPDAVLDGDIEGFDERGRQAPHFSNECVRQHVIDPGCRRTQVLEIVTMHTQGLTAIERDSRTTARARREQCQLTEVLRCAKHPDHRLVAERGRDANRKVTFDDHVQRVAWVAIVEHHFVAPEAPSPCFRQDSPSLIVIQNVQQV